MNVLKRFYFDQKDLIFATFIMAACTILIWFFGSFTGSLRTIVALTAVLIVPGYLFTTALFPRQSDLDPIQRLALSLGFSVVTIVLVGLLLNYSPLTIRAESFTVILLLWVLILCSITLARRQIYRETYFMLKFRGRHVLLGLALLSVGLSVANLIIPAQRYTEFYILGDEGRLDSYPRTLNGNQAFPLTLGVINREGRNQTYSVRAFSIGAEGSEQVWSTLEILAPLANGQTWEGDLKLVAPPETGNHLLKLELYRQRDSTPYRTLRLYISVVSAGAASSTALLN